MLQLTMSATVEPSFACPGLSRSLFVMCIGIMWNNSLVEGQTLLDRALNPAPEAHHAPLHKAPECVDHWATWAGYFMDKSTWKIETYNAWRSAGRQVSETIQFLGTRVQSPFSNPKHPAGDLASGPLLHPSIFKILVSISSPKTAKSKQWSIMVTKENKKCRTFVAFLYP